MGVLTPSNQLPHLCFGGWDSPPFNHIKQKKMETKKIKGEDVLDIQPLTGTFNYDAATKLAGQTYRRFAYNGTVFTVNTQDAFCTAFDNGVLYAVTFGINDEGQFSMVGFNTQDQVRNLRKFEAECKSFERVVTTISEQEATAAL